MRTSVREPFPPTPPSLFCFSPKVSRVKTVMEIYVRVSMREDLEWFMGEQVSQVQKRGLEVKRSQTHIKKNREASVRKQERDRKGWESLGQQRNYAQSSSESGLISFFVELSDVGRRCISSVSVLTNGSRFERDDGERSAVVEGRVLSRVGGKKVWYLGGVRADRFKCLSAHPSHPSGKRTTRFTWPTPKDRSRNRRTGRLSTVEVDQL